MATNELVIVDANVKRTENLTESGQIVRQIGEAATKIQPVYYDQATQKYLLADASDSDKIAVTNVTFDAGALDDFVALVKNDAEVDVGAILTAGRTYFLSDTAGKIIEEKDLATMAGGSAVVRLGFSKSASVLKLDIKNYGVTV